MKMYKKKWRFWWEFSMLWSVAYMLYTTDFYLELTMKYRKTYIQWDMKYWNKYNDIVEWNIRDKQFENLQIYYRGKEWWKFKWKKLIEMFIDMKNKHTKDVLEKIFKTEYKKQFWDK